MCPSVRVFQHIQYQRVYRVKVLAEVKGPGQGVTTYLSSLSLFGQVSVKMCRWMQRCGLISDPADETDLKISDKVKEIIAKDNSLSAFKQISGSRVSSCLQFSKLTCALDDQCVAFLDCHPSTARVVNWGRHGISRSLSNQNSVPTFFDFVQLLFTFLSASCFSSRYLLSSISSISIFASLLLLR